MNHVLKQLQILSLINKMVFEHLKKVSNQANTSEDAKEVERSKNLKNGDTHFVIFFKFVTIIKYPHNKLVQVRRLIKIKLQVSMMKKEQKYLIVSHVNKWC